MTVPDRFHLGRSRLLLLALAVAVLLPVAFCLRTSLADAHLYPGKDLWPKIVGARRFAAGLDPYAAPLNPADPPALRSNQVPYNTPAAFLLYMPLRNLPYATQRTAYFALGLLAACAAFLLLSRWACNTPEQRLFLWALFAAFVLCSFSLRLELERGQYYALLLLLSAHAAIALRNRWSGWLAALPSALLIAIRPTYGLVLIAALLCGQRRWALRVAAAGAVLFALTLPFGGLRSWSLFAQAVREHQASYLAMIPSYCGTVGNTSSTASPELVIAGVDFSRGLDVHSITGTFLGLSMVRYGILSPRLAFLCGYPSPRIIARVNAVLLVLAIAGGFGLLLLARRARITPGLLAAGSLLWPILVEMFSPERNLYTALLEFVPLALLLVDREGLPAVGRRGKVVWGALLVLALAPSIGYQLLHGLAAREAASVAILILLPLALAAGWCVAVFSNAPPAQTAS